MLNFRAIEISDKQNVEACLKHSLDRSCDLSFLNLFSWQHVYGTQLCFEQGQLFVRYRRDNQVRYAFPAGDGDPFVNINKLIQFVGPDLTLYMSEPNKNSLLTLYPEQFDILEERDSFDYVYERDSLATLQGRKYNSKRNHISRFCKKYPDYKVKDITQENIQDVMKVFEQWSAGHTGGNDKEALQCALHYYHVLHCYGILIYVHENPVAFTFGTNRNVDMFDTHFEKCTPEFVDCYSLINRELAQRLSCRYINREDDIGLEGLRKAKLSYHPVFFIKKYLAVLKK